MKTRINAMPEIMLKKIRTLVPLCMLLFLSSASLSAQGTYFSLDTIVAEPGDMVTFSVMAHNLNDVGAITLYISVSNSGLTFVGADNWGYAKNIACHNNKQSGDTSGIQSCHRRGAGHLFLGKKQF